MSTQNLHRELDSLKGSEQIADWSYSLGYGEAEYTLDLNNNSKINIKTLAKRLNTTYGAKSFTRYVDGSRVAIKFVIDL